MTTRNDSLISDFISTLRDDSDFGLPHARIPANHPEAKRGQVVPIKSTNHNLQAYAFDRVGNMTALLEDGRVHQYIGSDEINVALGRI